MKNIDAENFKATQYFLCLAIKLEKSINNIWMETKRKSLPNKILYWGCFVNIYGAMKY